MPPKKDEVVYTIRNIGTGKLQDLRIPFVVLKPSWKFQDTQSYFDLVCNEVKLPTIIASNSTSNSTVKNSTEGAKRVRRSLPISAELFSPVKLSPPQTPALELMQEVPLTPGLELGTPKPNERVAAPRIAETIGEAESSFAFFHLSNNTVVLKISSFSDINGSASVLAKIMENMNMVVKKGYKNLILDVRGNGGGKRFLNAGIICLGYSLARLLFPTSTDHETDFIISDLWNSIVDSHSQSNRTSIFNYRRFLDSEGQEFNSTESFKNGPTLTRGGKTSMYTQRAVLDCSDLYAKLPNSSTPIFPVDRIRILSNGYCGRYVNLLM